MFHKFTDKVNKKFLQMQKDYETLYRVDLDKDIIWNAYLNAFPAGTNEIFQERTEYDCTMCKQFIRNVGNVVAIMSNGNIDTIWDIDTTDETFSIVSSSLNKLVLSKPINNIFIYNEGKVGKQNNPAVLKDGSTRIFNHFYADINAKFYNRDIANTTHPFRTNAEMFERALNDLTVDALETTIDLIKQNSIYRGAEHLNSVKEFLVAKKKYSLCEDALKNSFIWSYVKNYQVTRFKNTVIGSLISDLSDFVELDVAVKSFESKVAPANYKRSSALITPKMIELAINKIKDLGIEDALKRRNAKLSDISINNVLFADKDSAKEMKDRLSELTDILMTQTKTSKKTFDRVEEISIEDFIKHVLPSASKIEIMPENKHLSNLVSLIAPEVTEAKNILKWNNNFSWAYNGNVTDSIKETVKSAGGNVDGDLRISLSWVNNDDLDLHCFTPNGSHIYFSDKRPYRTKGQLDIDMQNGGSVAKPSVENIFWIKESDLETGEYNITVHQYAKRDTSGQGFTIEVDFKGELYNFTSNTNGTNKEVISICTLKYDKVNGLTVKKTNDKLTDGTTSKVKWNVKTQEFVPVTSVMYSPNYWDEQEIGNKHYMFMLKDCKNPDDIRGLYNEFLSNELNEHRKVFEVLGDKTKCPYSDEQMSGLGFSSTVRNSIICKVSGNVTRILKINF